MPARRLMSSTRSPSTPTFANSSRAASRSASWRPAGDGGPCAPDLALRGYAGKPEMTRRSVIRPPAGLRAGAQEVSLPGVARERGGALELGARLAVPAEAGEQVAADAREVVVARERGLLEETVGERE